MLFKVTIKQKQCNVPALTVVNYQQLANLVSWLKNIMTCRYFIKYISYSNHGLAAIFSAVNILLKISETVAGQNWCKSITTSSSGDWPGLPTLPLLRLSQ